MTLARLLITLTFFAFGLMTVFGQDEDLATTVLPCEAPDPITEAEFADWQEAENDPIKGSAIQGFIVPNMSGGPVSIFIVGTRNLTEFDAASEVKLEWRYANGDPLPNYAYKAVLKIHPGQQLVGTMNGIPQNLIDPVVQLIASWKGEEVEVPLHQLDFANVGYSLSKFAYVDDEARCTQIKAQAEIIAGENVDASFSYNLSDEWEGATFKVIWYETANPAEDHKVRTMVEEYETIEEMTSAFWFADRNIGLVVIIEKPNGERYLSVPGNAAFGSIINVTPISGTD